MVQSIKSLIKEEVEKILKLREDAKTIAQQLKGKTVTNPETKKKILATTALSYGSDHPAYKAAKSLVKLVSKKIDKKSKPDIKKSQASQLVKDTYPEIKKGITKSIKDTNFEDKEDFAEYISDYLDREEKGLSVKDHNVIISALWKEMGKDKISKSVEPKGANLKKFKDELKKELSGMNISDDPDKEGFWLGPGWKPGGNVEHSKSIEKKNKEKIISYVKKMGGKKIEQGYELPNGIKLFL